MELHEIAGEKWMRWDRRLLRDQVGTPRRVVGVVIDFTEEHLRLSAAERNSEIDLLTGLLNRRGLASRYLQMTTRSGFGVLTIDLDGFKQVNDRFGHAAGDVVLRETAHRRGICVRKTDLVARIGGDEFVLVATGDLRAIEDVTERVVATMRQPLSSEGIEVEVKATVGGIWTRTGGVLDELVPQADAIMYSAKAAGKDRWQSKALGRSLGTGRTHSIPRPPQP